VYGGYGYEYGDGVYSNACVIGCCHGGGPLGGGGPDGRDPPANRSGPAGRGFARRGFVAPPNPIGLFALSGVCGKRVRLKGQVAGMLGFSIGFTLGSGGIPSVVDAGASGRGITGASSCWTTGSSFRTSQTGTDAA
jgi:hypothetical protein